MKRSKLPQLESYCEGTLDQSTISYFLKHLDNFNATIKIKHRLKVIIIELVSNILAHSETNYGSISIQHINNDFVVRASNYASPERISRTLELAGQIKIKTDLRQHYLGLLSEVTMDNQVSLGLIEIFRLSNGNTSVSSSELNGRKTINFEIKLEAGN